MSEWFCVQSVKADHNITRREAWREVGLEGGGGGGAMGTAFRWKHCETGSSSARCMRSWMESENVCVLRAGEGSDPFLLGYLSLCIHSIIMTSRVSALGCRVNR